MFQLRIFQRLVFAIACVIYFIPLMFLGELQGVEIGSGGYEEAINLLFEETLATMDIGGGIHDANYFINTKVMLQHPLVRASEIAKDPEAIYLLAKRAVRLSDSGEIARDYM
ncbi:hypothetical protein P8452_08021 [Trifolium repens]|nr:hypothetical protein P8452_08021 [Trifolium repens]